MHHNESYFIQIGALKKTKYQHVQFDHDKSVTYVTFPP